MPSRFTTQPTYSQASSEWMLKPSSSRGTPPGLEYLGLIDTLIIEQKNEWLEIFTGYETQNKYVIRNEVGQQEVMRIKRPLSCCSFCCCCAYPGSIFSQPLTVEAPPGRLARLKIGSDDCCGCNFNVQTLEGEVIGDITWQSRGLIHEIISDADTFGLHVPKDLDIKTQATLIGATFLIDFMFHER